MSDDLPHTRQRGSKLVVERDAMIGVLSALLTSYCAGHALHDVVAIDP